MSYNYVQTAREQDLALPHGGPVTGGVAQQLRTHQTRILFAHYKAGLAGTLLAVTAIAVLCWAIVPFWQLLVWYGLLLLLLWSRLRLARAFSHRTPADEAIGIWRRRFLIGSSATAVLTGASAWMIGSNEASLEIQILLSFILGGMCLAAVALLGGAFSVYLIYIGGLGLPLISWQLVQATPSSMTMAVLAMVFLAIMAAAGLAHNRFLMRLINLSAASRDLHGHQQRLRDFADMGADCFWESDAHGRFTYLSEGYKQLTGLTPQSMIGRSLADPGGPCLVPSRYLVRAGALQAAHEANLKPFHDHAIVWKLTDGNTAVLLSNGLPVIDSAGRFEGFRGTVRDITEQHRMAEKLTFQATHDALTELVNRREFERRLQTLIDNARLSNATHALCYLDLDQFKVVNDTSGHAAGDALLRDVAHELKGRVRSRDTLARLGGDEFGLLIEHCDAQNALVVAENIRSAIERMRFHWEKTTFNLTASAGVVVVNQNSENLAEIMKAADAACYTAKDAGRNRVHVYESDDSALSQRHGEMQWVTRITQALDNNRFVLAGQPISNPYESNLDDTRTVRANFEVLVRMRDDDDSLISPRAFLPAAERYNLMTRIDQWVVNALFEWLLLVPGRIDEVETCSVNLSQHSLGDGAFLEDLINRFKHGGVPGHKICFEITETAAMSNLTSAIGFMERLKQFGCRFALDDFGTGLSSFGYLKSLPVDYVKIDGVFVRDMLEDDIDHAMVKAIHQVGRIMGKKTVAEYVESRALLAELREIGIDYVQGFAIGKPTLLRPDEPVRSNDASVVRLVVGN